MKSEGVTGNDNVVIEKNKINYKEAIELAKRNESKVIKLQSVVRGFLQRKVNKMANELIDPKP